MSDTKLFRIDGGAARELPGSAVALERSLQTLIERNMDTMLGVRFLASEYSTGSIHRGRIDSLGLDENGSPVIVEYKRTLNENVINQGLFYLDWLMDHRGEFELLVLRKLGDEAAQGIDWSTPRLVCIAADYTRYDEHAVQQINRNIDLMRYRRFGEELLLLELANRVSVDALEVAASPSVERSEDEAVPAKAVNYKTISQVMETLDDELRDLLGQLESFVMALGDEVEKKVLKYYLAYRRVRNFVTVELHPMKRCLTLFVRLDPDEVELENGFTRDVREIGHLGTGDLEITVRSVADLEKAKPLIVRSYEAS